MAFQSSVNPSQLTQLGQANLAGDTRALYLKLFSGEMFKGFQRNTIARDLVMKRTLKNGKSLQFIYTGRTKSEFHTPGNSILGDSNNAPPVAEKTITVDDLLISSAFVYDLDETLSHYDLRSEISNERFTDVEILSGVAVNHLVPSLTHQIHTLPNISFRVNWFLLCSFSGCLWWILDAVSLICCLSWTWCSF